jgi:RNA polymerase sigma-70 factor (ECF subfamily)
LNQFCSANTNMTLNEQTEDLMARIGLGDRKALKSLHALVASQLTGVALNVLHDRAAAEDVVQDVFVGLWTKASQASAAPRNLAWLCVVTRNQAIDLLRKRKPNVPLHWQTETGEEAYHDIAADTPGIFERLQSEQESSQLHDCLKTLGAEPREAVLLAYCHGLTHVELAKRLQRPLGTIKAWTRRSLMQLRNCMEALA